MSDLTCADASHNKPFREYCPDCIREKNRRIEEQAERIEALEAQVAALRQRFSIGDLEFAETMNIYRPKGEQ